MKRYFITGTNTDCGKTYITSQLINQLNQDNKRVLGIKPVATGCSEFQGKLISSDAQIIAQANGRDDLEVCKWRFEPPISPHIAAQQAQVLLSAASIANFCMETQFTGYDVLLVEGAGGLLVPLNQQETWIDFIKLSQIPVILVVGMTLGCLNHALLTEAVIQANDLPCAGWIANCVDKEMLVLQENILTLKEKMHSRYLGTVGYGGNLSDEIGSLDF